VLSKVGIKRHSRILLARLVSAAAKNVDCLRTLLMIYMDVSDFVEFQVSNVNMHAVVLR